MLCACITPEQLESLECMVRTNSDRIAVVICLGHAPSVATWLFAWSALSNYCHLPLWQLGLQRTLSTCCCHLHLVLLRNGYTAQRGSFWDRYTVDIQG